jgi:hypothetical protein
VLFGVYPGGVVGDESGGLAAGPPDHPAHVTAALDELQAVLVRAYVPFTDATTLGRPHPTATPADAAQYAVRGRRLDLVAQYQSRSGDVAGYCAFLRDLIDQYGGVTDTLQVTEEPNVTDNPTLDGYYPAVGEALVAGVSAAKSHARFTGHAHLRIGFNTTPLFGQATGFLANLTTPSFIRDVDYIGLDFFPDVFRPVPAPDLAAAVAGLLRHHREAVLAPAGLADKPLHITEHGCPTGPDRTPARQAEVVETVVRTVAAEQVAVYSHFALRDADSTMPDLFHQFGLMTDDYTRKPAFTTYRKLIEEFTG